nr:FkbM family methyltransferase [Vibrio vulnificus]
MAYNNEVFLDAGGFDGDTAQEFADRYPDYKEVILVEPSEANISKARVRLSSYNRISYLQNAVSDENKQLNFTPDAGSASAIADSGEFMVDAIKIDTIKNSTLISTIKMDLEGWEMQALKGASQTISNKKPKLAIAVYHSSHDYIDIYKYIIGLNPNYKIYLRHYTEGWSETIMFFK